MTRDGAWYFLVTLVSASLVTAGTLIPKTQVAVNLSQFFVAVMAGASSWLLLRLRGFYTPTDQSTGREGGLRNGDMAMRNYCSRSYGQSAPTDEPGVAVYVATDETSKVDV